MAYLLTCRASPLGPLVSLAFSLLLDKYHLKAPSPIYLDVPTKTELAPKPNELLAAFPLYLDQRVQVHSPGRLRHRGQPLDLELFSSFLTTIPSDQGLSKDYEPSGAAIMPRHYLPPKIL